MKNIIYILLFLSMPFVVSGQHTMQNNGNLRMHSGAQFGFFGDFTNNGTFTNNLGTIQVIGTALQTFNGTNVIQANNLIVNNTANLQVDNEVQVSSVLTFTNGMILSDVADITTEFVHFLAGSSYSGATDAKYIDGVVRKTGNTTFSFPVGDDSNLQEISISAPSKATDHYTGYYLENDPDGTYSRSSKTGCVNHVSGCEYWILNRSGGVSNVEVTLNFDANSCGITNLCELIISRWDGSQWTSQGNGGITGITASGTVTSGTGCGSCGTAQDVTAFSPFTLGSSSTQNPLPIELLFFSATLLNNTTVMLEWQTASEINNDYFTIERSVNGIDWEQIKQVEGAGNSSLLINYSLSDENPHSGVSYYRLKQTDFDGQYSYSQTKSVNIKSLRNATVEIYPNPTEGQVIIIGNNIDLNQIRVYNVLSQDVTASTSITDNNQQKVVIDLSELSAGTYYIKTETTANMVYKQ